MRKESIVLATNADMSVDVRSNGVEINQEAMYSIEAVWTGTPVGVFHVEVSNDIVPLASTAGNPVGPNPSANVVNWVRHSHSCVDVTGTDGNWAWISQLAPYKWVRLAYDATSGTGNLNVSFFAKG